MGGGGPGPTEDGLLPCGSSGSPPPHDCPCTSTPPASSADVAGPGPRLTQHQALPSAAWCPGPTATCPVSPSQFPGGDWPRRGQDLSVAVEGSGREGARECQALRMGAPREPSCGCGGCLLHACVPGLEGDAPGTSLTHREGKSAMLLASIPVVRSRAHVAQLHVGPPFTWRCRWRSGA